jgi:hypothetical protein
MTRTHTARPVWTWKCDECGHEERIAREQNLLPSPDQMRALGWFIAKHYGDKCPECVMRAESGGSE